MTFKLPGKVDNDRKLLEEEVVKQLRIMRDNPKGSGDYVVALTRYKELHQQLLFERQLRDNRRGQLIDAGVTIGLAMLTLAAEAEMPLVSRWFNTLMRPMRTKRSEYKFDSD